MFTAFFVFSAITEETKVGRVLSELFIDPIKKITKMFH